MCDYSQDQDKLEPQDLGFQACMMKSASFIESIEWPCDVLVKVNRASRYMPASADAALEKMGSVFKRLNRDP